MRISLNLPSCLPQTSSHWGVFCGSLVETPVRSAYPKTEALSPGGRGLGRQGHKAITPYPAISPQPPEPALQMG